MVTKRPESSTTKQAFGLKLVLNAVGDGRRNVHYKNKDLIYRQGDAADAVYYIEKGGVQISVVSGQGKHGIIGVLGAGAFFGEGCLSGQSLNLSSVSANKPTTVIIISKVAMQRMLHDQPEFSEIFMSFLLSHNSQIVSDLVELLFNSSEKRLARVLLLLASFDKHGMISVVVPKVSQDDLASRVGTTRTRINFFMNKFRTLGLIEYDNDTMKVHPELMNVIVHD
ncbi:Crp/Fnr family transcriptional regulator [Magnetovibrio blakemorei]|uniref:Crp/Fnr family transcriptional regulator n=1 Tax=Magnetovibrio blakemorei TaxID=28181 RepID=A0A1E5Q2Z4_9PROT|nr:Crp/Fnr family transcriptional regulator [Magnetovibrio blakemorei]OEJ63795.1 Crp/Fnr family transcriptional regulator [Magnetovibrio blakemorei]